MRIEVLRKGSKGLKGTYANIDHHAKKLRPLVEDLVAHLTDKKSPLRPKFARWLQGANVHVFEADDGRKFVLRPVRDDGVYEGVQLSARFSRSNEQPLITLWCDYRNMMYPVDLLKVLYWCAETSPTAGAAKESTDG